VTKEKAASKVIIIGIDGASPGLLGWMLEENLLPNLQEIQQNGTSGTLLSTRHPITPAAWTSMLTGLGPGKHGLFDFRRRAYGTFAIELVRGKDRDGETIWHILSKAGYSVGVFNVPMTFPPERVNGFWVSGMDTPHTDVLFTYPSSLAPWLDRVTDGYAIDIGQDANSKEEYVAEALELQRKQQAAFENLLHRYQPNACMGVFVTTDRLQHAFWKYIDPHSAAFASPEATLPRKGLVQCYQEIDNLLGSILKDYVYGQGATLVVVSDHGFGPLYKDVYLNQWLMDQGYLKLKDHDKKGETLFDRIDWEKTYAYSFGYFGNLYLNLEGREPLGIVSPGREQHQILARITRELAKWRLPGESQFLVDAIYEVHELYSGPYVQLGPDLLVVMQDYAYMSRDAFDMPRGILFSDPMAYQQTTITHSGNHRMEGILLMVGENIEEGKRLEKASVIDVAPTILHLMERPIPTYMEGHVLTEAFQNTSPVQYAERRLESKAPTVHRLTRQIYLAEATINKQAQLITRLRQQLEWWNSFWPIKFLRWLKRTLT
jgi:predicted AlkP superfamily phosphohydrolase/phosphomutase